MTQPRNLIGVRFNKLFVLSKGVSRNKGSYWKCQCDCGNIKSVARSSLISGSVVSCGCFRRSRMETHNDSKSTEYTSWTAMKDRCYNPNSEHFNIYGLRGIRVCDKWIDSFENFLLDMGRKPYPELSLERVDVKGNYEPLNCKWATKSEQAWNRTKFRNNSSGVTGVIWVVRDNKWCARISFEGKRIFLGYFDKFEDAVQARKLAEVEYYAKEKQNA